jgi:voltage-gated potassium channel
MILGYGVIAVPTGIVTTELVRVGDSRRAALRRVTEGRRCESCELVGHEADARFCRGCGARLAAAEAAPATP